MCTVLANPLQLLATGPKRTRFTPANARIAQERAVQSRHERKMAQEIAAKLPVQLSGNSPQIVRVERQMDLIQRRLERDLDKLKPKEVSDLSASLGRLFDLWQVLTGTPNPGSRRGKPARSNGLSDISPISPEPIQAPQPVVVMPEPAKVIVAGDWQAVLY